MSIESTNDEQRDSVAVQRLVRRREDFDRGVVNSAIEEALVALGKAKMKLPLNLAHELQHAHDHLLNARDWVRLYSPNERSAAAGQSPHLTP